MDRGAPEQIATPSEFCLWPSVAALVGVSSRVNVARTGDSVELGRRDVLIRGDDFRHAFAVMNAARPRRT